MRLSNLSILFKKSLRINPRGISDDVLSHAERRKKHKNLKTDFDVAPISLENDDENDFDIFAGYYHQRFIRDF